jgi:phosphate transport system protein
MKHLDRALSQLSVDILTVGDKVEEALASAAQAYLGQDMVTARAVIEGDKEVDAREVEVEEECLKILALHQPVAADLRYVVTALKVNNDLERIGDLSANIGHRTVSLASLGEMHAPTTLSVMSRLSLEMVRKSLKALVDRDTKSAREVLEEDNRLDDLHRRTFSELMTLMASDSSAVTEATQHLSVSRCFERIGDLATNIAEDVIFLVDGDVVRHGGSI